MPIKADVKIKQGQGGSRGPRRVTVLFKLTHMPPISTQCHVVKTVLYSPPSNKAQRQDREGSYVAIFLKHKSCSQPVQGRYPVFLTHGLDSLEAAPLGLVSCFSKWLLNHTWLPAFAHLNTGCASRERCLCVQLFNPRVQLRVGTPCSHSGIHSFLTCDIQCHPFFSPPANIT